MNRCNCNTIKIYINDRPISRLADASLALDDLRDVRSQDRRYSGLVYVENGVPSSGQELENTRILTSHLCPRTQLQ
jgi:hypothetical protein